MTRETTDDSPSGSGPSTDAPRTRGTTSTDGAGRDGRLVGVDLARWVALIGMIGVHTMPERNLDGSLTWVEAAFGGRSSALFAVLLGVSLALMSGGTTRRHGEALGRDAAGIAVRAVLVGAIGLALGTLDSGIAVILGSYAVLMLLSCLFLAVPWPGLLALAAGWAVVSPLVSHLLRGTDLVPRGSRLNPTPDMLAEPLRLLGELTLTGYYPAFTWLTYALLGLAIGRMRLRLPEVALLLAGLGTVVALVAVVVSDVATRAVGLSEGELQRYTTSLYGVTPTGSTDLLLLRAPHSGAPLDLLTTAGSAAAAIGVCLLLVAGLGRVSGAAVRLVAVVFGAGTATLTLYSLHVYLRTPDLISGEGYPTYAAHVAVVSLIGAGLVLAGRRGPLEWATGLVPRLLRRR